MKRAILCIILFLLILMSSTPAIYGQFADIKSEPAYKKIFVDTDDFDAYYLRNLRIELAKAKNDTIRFSMLNDLAYYWHTRNLDTAMAYTKQGLSLTGFHKDSLWYGRFQITQGAILLRFDKLDSAYLVLQEAEKFVHKTDLPFLFTQLGYVFERKGQLDKAADYTMKSLTLGEELADKKAIALAYSDFSNLFWKQGKYDKGLEYGLKSVKLFEDRGINDLDYDFTLYVVGNNYLALKNYQQALAYYKQSIVLGERYGFYNNLSDVYISLTDLYTFLGQYQKAGIAGQNAILYARLLGNNNFMLMRSWLSVGKSQNKQGNYGSAIRSLQKSIAIATDNFGDEYYLSQAYESLAEAYAGNQQLAEAYEAQVEFDKLKDIIFTTEADERISELQTMFEVTKKDNTIQLQEAQLQQEKLRQMFITIIAAFLMLFIIFLYRSSQINRKKNKLLEKQNQEKEFLLKEIHHRVKNNLGVVSGLLALQSEQIDDPKVKEAMYESQNRINSMSIIHQRLYQGKNLATIEMKDYFMNLCAHILDSFGAESRVKLQCTIDPVEFDVDTAVPLGLIVNELITNSLKYAFPDNSHGEILLGLQKQGGNTYYLEVADNGIGRQKGEVKGTGFGTQLINLLVQQLGGELDIINENGTKVSLTFNIEPTEH